MARVSRTESLCEYGMITQTIKVLGGRWKLLIVKLIMEKDRLRYSQILKHFPEMTEKSLSSVLKDLQQDFILKRQELKSKEPKVVYYSLTSFGQSLQPLLVEMENFGQRFMEQRNDQ